MAKDSVAAIEELTAYKKKILDTVLSDEAIIDCVRAVCEGDMTDVQQIQQVIFNIGLAEVGIQIHLRNARNQ